MVRRYYVDEITDLSEQELQPVCRTIESPACLLGGWAVHLHVNDGFQAAYGREYIGSRDIDIGFHVDPAWGEEELRDAPVGRSLQQLKEDGYVPLSFRLVRYFNQDTGEGISEEEAQSLPQHQVFQLFLDIIPDTDDLDTFHEALGFRPPAEPLLQHAFADDAAAPLAAYHDWDIPDTVHIADADLVAAMKIRSILDRDETQKRVKDIADLHALLWYVREYRKMRSAVRRRVSEMDIDQLQDHVGEGVYADAAQLLQIDTQLVQDSVEQLML